MRGLISFTPLFEFRGHLTPDTVEDIIKIQITRRERQLEQLERDLDLNATPYLVSFVRRAGIRCEFRAGVVSVTYSGTVLPAAAIVIVLSVILCGIPLAIVLS